MRHETLALEGGTPVRTEPFPPWPYFADDEIAAVESVLRSGKVNYWTGQEGREFEKEVRGLHGTTSGVLRCKSVTKKSVIVEKLW